MSSTSASSSSQWPPQRPSKRSKLRNGTFVIPGTGERSRRHFSLRATSSLAQPSEEPSRFQSLDAQETFKEQLQAIVHNAKVAAGYLWDWTKSPNGRGVLKCSLAYFLGSLATYWAPLSGFLGNRDGKHIVATITVYFHPSRTVGSMLEAIVIAIIGVMYAEVISLLSMAVSILFGARLGLVPLARALVVLLFIGAALGFVGWVKQRMNSALVNVASTLTSIAIISVVTKEEAVHGGEFSAVKIIQVLKMLLMGISITTAVNVLAWRVSARDLLRQSMSEASVALGDVLSIITRGFLHGTEGEVRSQSFAKVIERYSIQYKKTTVNMRESKFECYFLGRERQYGLEKAVVKSIDVLAQAIGGLRSASNTQFALLKEAPGDPHGCQLSPGSTVFSPTLTRAMSTYLKRARERFGTLDSIDESDENLEESATSLEDSRDSLDFEMPTPMFQAPSEIFELFITLLGPSMKSLAFTLSEILKQPPFGSAPNPEITINGNFKSSLRDALDLYNNARAGALQELYKSIELSRSRSEKIQADIEEVAAACGHFSFSLQAVADEMDAYLDAVAELKVVAESSHRTWSWLRFWTSWSWFAEHPVAIRSDGEAEMLLGQHPAEVKPIKQSAVPKGIPDQMTKQRDSYSWDAAPQASRAIRAASQTVLGVLRVLGREDIRFGLKVAAGAALWAMFAFLPATRPTYQHWRGEWGLLSFMIVVSMTVGASNTTGFARLQGTVIGASLACLGWVVSRGNALVLLFLGWLVSLFSFYLFLVVRNGPLGRVTLLAWNVTVLYAYSLSQKVEDDDDDDLDMSGRPSIFEIAAHRAVAVTLGILWGMIVCRAVWPISGRRKFKEGLAVLYLQLGLIWKRGPLSQLVQGDTPASYLKPGEQAALQRYAFKLEALRAAAKSEFELRGPFPEKPYERIMQCTRRILDGFYAMSLLAQKRTRLSEGERRLLDFTAPERAMLCDRIAHVFQVIASSIMLEYPLTDAIPSVAGIKDRLLGKIYHFRKNHVEEAGDDGRLAVEESDYSLVYAYTLVTSQVAEELATVRREIESLFGVLHEESLLLQ